MVNLLLCGNKGVFDGALSELISITNKTQEPINCYIFTMDLQRIDEKYKPIEQNQIDFLNKIIKSKNIENNVTKIDVTDIYEKEFHKCVNESAYCTPYTLIRLFADIVPNMPDKLLYLDIDIMVNGDISNLYNTNIEQYEYAAVKEKYGSKLIKSDYINAGMLLMNIKKIKETGLLKKAREKIQTTKMLFADQDAIYRSTTSKLLLPRIYNEQGKFNKPDTIICHFTKRLLILPYPHIVNYKQWHIDKIHKYYKCYIFDKDLEEYKTLKQEYEIEGEIYETK